MMGELQQEQYSDLIYRGRRALSFPIYEPLDKPANNMGRSYRTLSPRREPYYAEGRSTLHERRFRTSLTAAQAKK